MKLIKEKVTAYWKRKANTFFKIERNTFKKKMRDAIIHKTKPLIPEDLLRHPDFPQKSEGCNFPSLRFSNFETQFCLNEVELVVVHVVK